MTRARRFTDRPELPTFHCGLLALTLAACGGTTYHRQGPVVRDVPAPLPLGTITEGPLSTRRKVPNTPPPQRSKAQDEARRIYLDKVAIHEDGEAYLKLVGELFPHPATSELKSGVEQANQQTALLEGLAPYALDSLADGYLSLYGRLPLCARPPGQMWHCYPDLAERPATTEAFEVLETAPGVMLLTIRDAGANGDWGGAFDRLASARAIVLDMRTAAGTDPRPLLPLLEKLTGRAPFKPLREIRRPAAFAPYVANYQARFLSETRDPAAWSNLVGEMPGAKTPPTKQPIAVIVGPGCGPACELVARSLVTYAHATLYGSAGGSGRLERDEPALMVLPHSKIEIYFNATEYLLNDDIEQATGPTPEWYLRTVDSAPDDIVAFAARDLTSAPPRCETMPGYATVEKMPRAVLDKIPNAGTLGSCPWAVQVTIETKAPLSAMKRFVETCKEHVELYGSFQNRLSTSARSLGALTQIAQSDLVTRIDIDCEPPPEPD